MSSSFLRTRTVTDKSVIQSHTHTHTEREREKDKQTHQHGDLSRASGVADPECTRGGFSGLLADLGGDSLWRKADLRVAEGVANLGPHAELAWVAGGMGLVP